MFYNQGRFAEAEVLLRGVLSGYRERFGVDHPDTLAILNNLVNSL